MVRVSDILAAVDQIVLRFRPRKIMLFGSMARAMPRDGSDIDLLVVMEDGGQPIELAGEIRAGLRNIGPVDVVVLSPRALAARRRGGDSFIKEILDQGRVVYDRQSRRVGEQSRRRLQKHAHTPPVDSRTGAGKHMFSRATMR